VSLIPLPLTPHHDEGQRTSENRKGKAGQCQTTEDAANKGHVEVQPVNEAASTASFVLLCSRRARQLSTTNGEYTPLSPVPLPRRYPPKAAFHPK